jgi:hypothetical protein
LDEWRAGLLLAHCSIPGTLDFPALCRASVGLNDVLLGPRPSLPMEESDRAVVSMNQTNKEEQSSAEPGFAFFEAQ